VFERDRAEAKLKIAVEALETITRIHPCSDISTAQFYAQEVLDELFEWSLKKNERMGSH
jgi:hypothetical protein